MMTVKTVDSLSELQQNMPLFMEGFRAMNRRHKAFDCDEQGFIKTLVGILGTGPDNVIGLLVNDGEVVGYGAGFDDTPTYCGQRHFLLWALYVKPDYSRLGSKILFDAASDYAKKYGYDKLRAHNGRLNGSSLKFFEKVLGMRRNRIEFTKQLS